MSLKSESFTFVTPLFCCRGHWIAPSKVDQLTDFPAVDAKRGYGRAPLFTGQQIAQTFYATKMVQTKKRLKSMNSVSALQVSSVSGFSSLGRSRFRLGDPGPPESDSRLLSSDLFLFKQTKSPSKPRNCLIRGEIQRTPSSKMASALPRLL